MSSFVNTVSREQVRRPCRHPRTLTLSIISAYIRVQPKPSVNQASSPVPGPGEYNVNQSSAALARNIARTAFDSKSTRGFEPRADVPAPGQYDNPIQLGTSQARANSSPQPVFKSGVRRLADTTGPAAFTPGPGAYNAADAERALRYDWIARAHSSAAFQASAADRFGHIPGKLATDGELGACLWMSTAPHCSLLTRCS